MRPVEVTPEAIITAGQELKAEGKNVTGFALRTRIGGGKPERLKQVWNEHQTAQAGPAQPAPELPAELAEAVAAVGQAFAEKLQGIAQDLNERAVRAASRRVADVEQDAAQQIEAARREVADATSAVEAIEVERDNLAQERMHLGQEVAQMRQDLQAGAVKLAEASTRAQELSAAHSRALTTHADELERLQRSHTQTLDEAHQLAEQLRAELAKARKEAADSRAAVDELRGKLAAVGSDLAKSIAEHKAAAQAASEQRSATAKAEGERDQARADLASVREDAAALRARLAAAAESSPSAPPKGGAKPK